MRIYLFLALVFVLFTGCIRQEFHQTVDKDGSSTLAATYDFAQFIELSSEYGAQYGMPGGITQSAFAVQMQERCTAARQTNPSMECAVNGTTLQMTVPLEADNPYYDFEVEENLLFRTYRFTLHTVPLDRFDAGASVDERLEPPEPVDLTDKSKNAQQAQSLRLINGFAFTYAVEMPGSVVTATAGTYEAEIDGNTATFDMLEVLQDSAPLTVESQELNFFFLVAVVAVLLIVAVALAFLKHKKSSK
ncbi:MAG TPA: hypothetical protein VJH24_01325 [Candidatus Bilamarchaeaceae archaeon]|nr:hypothetical protein [Candidatus Bilamarchaeaceae archaeon]